MSQVGGKAFDFKLFLKVMAYAKPYRALFIFSVILTIVLGGLGTARPILIRSVIDDAILMNDAPEIVRLMLLLVGLLVVEALGQFGFMYAANWLGQSIIKDIRVELYDKLQSFRLGFYDRTPIGQLVTRVVSDIESIASIFSQGLFMIFSDLLKMIVVLGIMIYMNWKLTLIVICAMPIVIIATNIFQKKMKVAFKEVRAEISNLNTFVQEHLGGMAVVQAFGREAQEYDKFEAINDRHRKANVRSIFYYALFFPIIEVLSAISIGLAVWYGGMNAATGGSVTVGELTAMIIFVGMLFRPLRQLADRFNTLQMGMVASERVLNLLDNTSDIEPNGAVQLSELQGAIDFKNIHFHYQADEPILRDVSFAVAPGETVAIVGATGAGKSTIISVLMGFYPYQSGSVTIDGHELTTLDLHALRTQLALVLQDVFLFSDTVRSNIVLGEGDITDAQIMQAAREIGIEEFIEGLPQGLDYNVQERGGVLSAGQRQLLAFLRAYITNPSVLILDEATSSIDSHTEELIQRALIALTQDRTSVIIAHRLSTIQHADRIIVLDKGQVVEVGSHAALLEAKGAYHNLYEKQFASEV